MYKRRILRRHSIIFGYQSTMRKQLITVSSRAYTDVPTFRQNVFDYGGFTRTQINYDNMSRRCYSGDNDECRFRYSDRRCE